MIGVVANAEDLRVAGEFFELFKTPWEPAVASRKYAVILTVGEPIDGLNADAFLVYGSDASEADVHGGIAVDHINGPVDIRGDDPGRAQTIVLIYGRMALFRGGTGIVRRGDAALDYRSDDGRGSMRRIGYDLFREVAFLLTQGQPKSWAATPALDLHIALLRRLLRDLEVPFLEIPPRPQGHDFVCCLTHDVDFFGIRAHTFDRTLMGFAVRASVGTLVDVVRRRRPLGEAMRNWAAFLSLPLVFLKLKPDFWRPFEDYATAEKGRPSTFFLIPFKARPGLAPDGAVRTGRQVPYQMSEISEQASDVMASGHELAVHGIDAWRDADAGRAELTELTAITGGHTGGVRMHWLYFDGDSAARLEEAGYTYDSTWGYNDAVGYRAGTSQVFRPSGTEQLLELPMSIMDSAMFYPNRMGLTDAEASESCHAIAENARRFGGTIVVNWHDRSLAPERLWGRCYHELLSEIAKDDRAWFATAGDAVDWFRWRRSIRFDDDGNGSVSVAAEAVPPGLPAVRIAVHRPGSAPDADVDELPFDGEKVLRLAL